MRNYLSSFVLLLFLSVQIGTAQDAIEAIWLLSPRDTLLLNVEDGRKIILHPVKPKQSLFSIARFYNLSLEELIANNPEYREDMTLKIGTQVRVPIPNRAIRRYKGKDFKAVEYTPIYYVVKSGETLYQIAKRYFNMPVDTVASRNKLKNHAIKPGQRLHIGWMGIEGIHSDWRPSQAPNAYGEPQLYHAQAKGRKEIESQGVCFWQKDSKEKGDLYALHRDATIGTIISVFNPMSNRTVYAKVIARIPDGYERNVEVILSPEAARKIGALDPKFFVKVKYLK